MSGIDDLNLYLTAEPQDGRGCHNAMLRLQYLRDLRGKEGEVFVETGEAFRGGG